MVPLVTTVFVLLSMLALFEGVSSPKRLSISVIAHFKLGYKVNYGNIRLRSDFEVSIHNLFLYFDWHSDDKSGTEVGLGYFKMERAFQMMNEEKSYSYFHELFQNYNGSIPQFVLDEETSAVIAKLKGIMSKIFSHFGKIVKEKWKITLLNVKFYLLAYFSVLLHYFDLTKDIFMIKLTWNSSRTVSIQFICMVVLTEVANFMTCVSSPVFRTLPSKQKVICVCMSPLAPCILQVKLARLRVKEAKLMESLRELDSLFQWDSIIGLESELAENRASRVKLEELVAELKVNESIFECYPFIHMVTCLYVMQNFTIIEDKSVIYDEISSEIFWAIVPAYFGLLLTHINYTQSQHHSQITISGLIFHVSSFMLTQLIRHFLVVLLLLLPTLNLKSQLNRRKKCWSDELYDFSNDTTVMLQEACCSQYDLLLYPNDQARNSSTIPTSPFKDVVKKFLSPNGVIIEGGDNTFTLHIDLIAYLAFAFFSLTQVGTRQWNWLSHFRESFYSIICPPLHINWNDMPRTREKRWIDLDHRSRRLKVARLIVMKMSLTCFPKQNMLEKFELLHSQDSITNESSHSIIFYYFPTDFTFYLYRDGLKSGPQVARIFCLALPCCCLAKQVNFLAHLCRANHPTYQPIF